MNRNLPFLLAYLFVEVLRCGHAAQTDWQDTLKRSLIEASNPPYLLACISTTHAFVFLDLTVPSDAGRIFATENRDEIIQFLKKLSPAESPLSKQHIKTWIFILEKQLKGIPSTQTTTYQGKQIRFQVYNYCFNRKLNEDANRNKEIKP